MNNYAIILAAGKGMRMKSSKYKILHSVLGKPMISHVIDNLKNIDFKRKIVVISEGADEVINLLKDDVEFAYQYEQLGTGHAVKMVEDKLSGLEGNTLVICGDTPLITSETIEKLFIIQKEKNADITILTTKIDNPYGYGRIVRDEKGVVVKIVEEKDANEVEKLITEINTGTYCFNNKKLFHALTFLKNDNKQKEYYLTDVIKIIKEMNGSVYAFETEDQEEVIGINDRRALEKANQILKRRVNNKLMVSGVTIIDSENTYISVDTNIGQDTVIYPGTIIMGKNKIGSNCHIGPNTELENVKVADNVEIRHSVITDSIIGKNTSVGPFAHFRNKTIIGENVRIGNFVEIKNSEVKDNSKAAHLTYIGDAELGKNVNMGCGTITVNYDGKNKHKTIIKDNVFVGCNSNLIAPIVVEENSYIAAGSTINKNVPQETLAIARAKQENKIGYAKKYQK